MKTLAIPLASIILFFHCNKSHCEPNDNYTYCFLLLGTELW